MFDTSQKDQRSFVYVPKKPIALNPDGSLNTEKVCELVVKAKAGDNKALKSFNGDNPEAFSGYLKSGKNLKYYFICLYSFNYLALR